MRRPIEQVAQKPQWTYSTCDTVTLSGHTCCNMPGMLVLTVLEYCSRLGWTLHVDTHMPSVRCWYTRWKCWYFSKAKGWRSWQVGHLRDERRLHGIVCRTHYSLKKILKAVVQVMILFFFSGLFSIRADILIMVMMRVIVRSRRESQTLQTMQKMKHRLSLMPCFCTCYTDLDLYLKLNGILDYESCCCLSTQCGVQEVRTLKTSNWKIFEEYSMTWWTICDSLLKLIIV